MTTFYATYSASVGGGLPVTATQGTIPWVVDGQGTAGTPVGGVVSIQGVSGGTAIPISGSITATNPSVGATGSTIPADATYMGGLNGGNLVGVAVDSSGHPVIVGAGTAGTSSGGVVSIQGVVSGTTVPVTAAQATASNLNATIVGAGSAGTANAGVVTVQGIASMTPILVTQSGSGTQQAVNVAQFGGSNVATGTGTGGVGVPRVTVSSDSSLTSVTTVSTVTAVTAISNALPAGTNLLGKTGIDQTTPGSTNAIQATSGTTAAWQAEGNVAFGSLTSSYATVFTPSASTKILFMRNNTNAAVSVSMDAGTTTNFIFDAGDQIAIDFIANGLQSTTTAIQVKYTVGAPTSGSFRVNGAH